VARCFKGSITKLSPREAEARLENPVPALSNLRITFLGADGREVSGALYGKVVGTVAGNDTSCSVRFTSMSPEIETLLRCRCGAGGTPASSATSSAAACGE